jgi:plasmid maintenance system antidote protein VapI
MSRSSSPTSSHEDDDAAVLALAGGKVTKAPQIDPSDLEIAVALGRVRGQILAAAKRDGIGVRELARRMEISASAVSRQLRSEGDMRFSTAILFARALGRRWHFSLSLSEPVSDASDRTRTSKPSESVPRPQAYCNKGRAPTPTPTPSKSVLRASACSRFLRRKSKQIVTRNSPR